MPVLLFGSNQSLLLFVGQLVYHPSVTVSLTCGPVESAPVHRIRTTEPRTLPPWCCSSGAINSLYFSQPILTMFEKSVNMKRKYHTISQNVFRAKVLTSTTARRTRLLTL